jgi:hypothetical protein
MNKLMQRLTMKTNRENAGIKCIVSINALYQRRVNVGVIALHQFIGPLEDTSQHVWLWVILFLVCLMNPSDDDAGADIPGGSNFMIHLAPGYLSDSRFIIW